MRSHHDFVKFEQRRLGHRLCGEHVERGAGDDAVTDRVGQRLFVDDATAGDIDDTQARLGLKQQVTSDNSGGLFVFGKVNGEEVRLGNYLIEGEQFHPHLATAFGRDERIEGDDSHAKGLGPVGDQFTNPSKTDDAKGLVGELDAFPARPLPPTSLERRMRLRNVSSLREQQRHRVLGRRDDVRLWGVHHHHPTPCRRSDVDVVQSDSCPTDDHQVGSNFEQRRIDLRCRADDQRVRSDDVRIQLGQIEVHIDFVTSRPQPVKSTIGNFFGHQNTSHTVMFIATATKRNPRLDVLFARCPCPSLAFATTN